MELPEGPWVDKKSTFYQILQHPVIKAVEAKMLGLDFYKNIYIFTKYFIPEKISHFYSLRAEIFKGDKQHKREEKGKLFFIFCLLKVGQGSELRRFVPYKVFLLTLSLRIWQCMDGHPVCDTCRRRPQVTACPVCRQDSRIWSQHQFFMNSLYLFQDCRFWSQYYDFCWMGCE